MTQTAAAGAATAHAAVRTGPDAARVRVFVLDDDRTFGDALTARLGVVTAPHEDRRFEDGEHKVRPLVSVRDADVFLIASLYGSAESSVHDKLCRMLFFAATVRDAGAARVTAVVPYLCYARKDCRTKARDPVTTRYVASLCEAAGIDTMLTMDVHNVAAYQNAFRCRAEHLEGRPIFVSHLAPRLRGVDVVVVAPDAGGVKRADAFRASLARALVQPIDLAFMEKRRSEGTVSGTAFTGEVAGRTAIVVDDLVSSGTTLARAARACRERGATRTLGVATHGLFSAGASEALVEPGLERVFVLDTVSPVRLPAGVARERLTVLDAAPVFAEAVRRLHVGGSLVELLEG
jgi:ribose-phosphate pyrophosphokinase